MRVAESCGDLDTFYAEQCWEGTWDRMTSEAWSWSADCIWYLTPQTRTIISCELSPPTDSVQQQSTKSQLYILPPFQFEGNAPLQLVSAGWWSLAEIQHGQGHQLVITALQASSHGNMSRAPLNTFYTLSMILRQLMVTQKKLTQTSHSLTLELTAKCQTFFHVLYPSVKL